jgi:hypothetical protein
LSGQGFAECELEVMPAEIVGLAGDNVPESTLMVLSVLADRGIWMDGEWPTSPTDSRKLGIEMFIRTPPRRKHHITKHFPDGADDYLGS